jgi:large repetitive protein
VKNYGTVTLTNISLSDSLAKVFNAQTGASYRVAALLGVSTGSTLAPNQAFNGGSIPNLLLPASSSLAAGRADTLTLTLNIATDGRPATYFSSVYARATAGADTTLRDVSTNGLNPDLNGNGSPSDANESEPTPLILGGSSQTVFIPEGFSPNGDGVNDLFVIRGTTGLTVDLEVYNRWGTVVYKNTDYKNDWGGITNANLTVGNVGQGLPDGTYFYVVRLSNGMEYVRYLTINR